LPARLPLTMPQSLLGQWGVFFKEQTMKILHLCDNLTGRTIKQCVLETQAGMDVTVTYNKCGIPKTASKHIDKLYKCGSIPALFRLVDECDIVVVHTTCTNYETIRIAEEIDKPVVWNIHDYVPECKPLLNLASAIIVPSVGYHDIIFPHIESPMEVIYGKVPTCMWPEWDVVTPRLEGCVCMNGAVAEKPIFRNYNWVNQQLEGRFFVLSAVMPSRMSHCMNVLEFQEYESMLQTMTQFPYGWAGAGNQDTHFDGIVNNKFWEMIAAGCVPICYKAAEMLQIAEHYGIGIDYPLIPNSLQVYRWKMLKNKEELCGESETPKINKLYRSVLKCKEITQ